MLNRRIGSMHPMSLSERVEERNESAFPNRVVFPKFVAVHYTSLHYPHCNRLKSVRLFYRSIHG